MFEEQEIKVRAKDLENLSAIIINLKEIGVEFAELNENHRYELTANHSEFMAMLHLYKEEDDITDED